MTRQEIEKAIETQETVIMYRPGISNVRVQINKLSDYDDNVAIIRHEGDSKANHFACHIRNLGK